jgi:putative mRNA 3-end processing factor
MVRTLIELQQGELKVPSSVLSLDARRRMACNFVSHAHGDHIGRHDRVIATGPTLALMRERLKGKTGGEVLPVGYREPFGLGDLTLELFPAGHVLGSAQIRVTRNTVSLCYTGDFCLEPTLTAEPTVPVPCDVLVMESTFGVSRYVFPPKEEVLRSVKKFVDDALSDKRTPVLLAYTLGKAQEILKYLGEIGHRLRAHPSIMALNRVYESLGIALPGVKTLGNQQAPLPEADEVVVVPPHLARTWLVQRIPRKRTAVLTGWAVDQGARLKYRGVDAAFPLSDHADFPALIAYAKRTGARKVFTVHGYAEELARALRQEGIRAEPLKPNHQLDLFDGLYEGQSSAA